MKYFLLYILFLSFSYSLNAQDEYFILWDKKGSAPAMAENILTAHRLIYDFQNKNIKPTYWKENNLKGKALGIGFRFAKSILLDVHIDFLLHTNQHLLFGTGYRLREFGFTQNNYNMFMFPPYGYGGGFARKGNRNLNRILGRHEALALEFGGVEAVNILSQKLRNKWLQRGSINYRESLLYLSTLYEGTLYSIAPELLNKRANNTYTVRYTKVINQINGFFDEENYPLKHGFLAKRSLVNLLNTYQFFAIYTYLKVYLLDGKENFEFPMIALGDAKWLPSIRFGLTPFGTELILENQLLRGKDFLEFTLRKGDGKLAKQYGAGLRILKQLDELVSLEGIYNVWHQPSMLLGGEQTFETKGGFGIQYSLSTNYHFEKSPVGIYAQFGYKTRGFIEGEKLDKGVIIRLGLSFRHAE